MYKRLKVAVALAVTVTSGCAMAMSKKPQAAPSEPQAQTAPTADSIWVGKSDNAKACAKERGTDVDDMAKELLSHEVQIQAKKKLHDSKMRIQMCGIDKGDMNGYLISKKDVEKAKELGFLPISGGP